MPGDDDPLRNAQEFAEALSQAAKSMKEMAKDSTKVSTNAGNIAAANPAVPPTAIATPPQMPGVSIATNMAAAAAGQQQRTQNQNLSDMVAASHTPDGSAAGPGESATSARQQAQGITAPNITNVPGAGQARGLGARIRDAFTQTVRDDRGLLNIAPTSQPPLSESPSPNPSQVIVSSESRALWDQVIGMGDRRRAEQREAQVGGRDIFDRFQDRRRTRKLEKQDLIDTSMMPAITDTAPMPVITQPTSFAPTPPPTAPPIVPPPPGPTPPLPTPPVNRPPNIPAPPVPPTPAPPTPAPPAPPGTPPAPTASPGGPSPTELTPEDISTRNPAGMIGTGMGSGEAAGGGGAYGLIMGGAKFLGGMALAGIHDLRFGRQEGLRYEESRLVAFGGTGEYKRFSDNMNRAMNKINVQNREIFERDVAQAYGQYYAQGMGGTGRANVLGPSGIQNQFGPIKNPFLSAAEYAIDQYDRQARTGEVRAAQTVGSMHTLAAMAGVNPDYVGGAMKSMYTSQAYYKAMASGIFTRDPATGDMLTTDEIVNQYYGRFKDNTPEQIRRALAPGGALAAELEATWGGDRALIESLTEGILMTSTNKGQIKAGDIEASARQAGYAGTREMTQGRDSEMRRLAAEERRLGTYVNDITAGVKTANNVVASLNDWLNNKAATPFVGAIESFGAVLDTFNTTMPQSLAKMVDAITAVTEKLAGLVGGEFFQDIIVGALSEGDWFVEKDQTVKVHQGEMVLPNRLATAVREELALNRTTVDSPRHTTGVGGKGGGASVNIYVSVSSGSDADALNLARKVKNIINNDAELTDIGRGSFG